MLRSTTTISRMVFNHQKVRCCSCFAVNKFGCFISMNSQAARLLPSASTSTRLRLVSTTSTLFNEHNNKSTNNFNIQDDDDFESRVIHSQTPVVVDFHAEWCGPCKLLGPRLEKEVDKHNGKVLLAKVDVDDMGLIAMKYKVMAVPSVMLFVGGEVKEKFEGNIDDDLLAAFVAKALN